MFNKEQLKEVMKQHGDLNKDMAAVIGVSIPNFSVIWNGRQHFQLKHVRLIAVHYNLTPQQVWDIFLFPDIKKDQEH